MPAEETTPLDELRRRIDQLSAELEELRGLVAGMQRTEIAAVTSPEAGEAADAELRALVGIDPPLSRSRERKEMRRILARRHAVS